MVGFGQPQEAPAVSSGGPRVVMQSDGVIGAEGVVVHPIPVSEPFNRLQRSRRKIRIALAYDPPVYRQRHDYLAGHLRIDLLSPGYSRG